MKFRYVQRLFWKVLHLVVPISASYMLSNCEQLESLLTGWHLGWWQYGMLPFTVLLLMSVELWYAEQLANGTNWIIIIIKRHCNNLAYILWLWRDNSKNIEVVGIHMYTYRVALPVMCIFSIYQFVNICKHNPFLLKFKCHVIFFQKMPNSITVDMIIIEIWNMFIKSQKGKLYRIDTGMKGQNQIKFLTAWIESKQIHIRQFKSIFMQHWPLHSGKFEY